MIKPRSLGHNLKCHDRGLLSVCFDHKLDHYFLVERCACGKDKTPLPQTWAQFADAEVALKLAV